MGSVKLYFVDYLGQGIPWLIPIMLFVLIFGLGMDYDIFIVTRMREEAARGLSDEDAIVEERLCGRFGVHCRGGSRAGKERTNHV